MAVEATPSHPLVSLQDTGRLFGSNERAGGRVRGEDQEIGGQEGGGPDPQDRAVHPGHHLRNRHGGEGRRAGR